MRPGALANTRHKAVSRNDKVGRDGPKHIGCLWIDGTMSRDGDRQGVWDLDGAWEWA